MHINKPQDEARGAVRRALMRSTVCMCSVPQVHNAPSAMAKECPKGVSEYSTFGGIS